MLLIRVTPRAKKNEVSEVQLDGTIKIRLTAPPVNGKANRALIQFLAGILKVPTSHLEIISGLKGRNKKIRVAGLNEQTIRAKINQHIK
jgi:uncharacterized protein (TIGR00251 family)